MKEIKMESHSKKKVFITGINGFTGKHLEVYLKKRGFQVYGTTLNKTSNKNYFKCDILSKDLLFEILNKVKPNYVIHLAAISFVASQDQENIYTVNVFGTMNLLNAIEKLDYNLNKILIVSSAAVYGNIEGELNEDMCPKAVNHYGNSKLVMENMTKPYFEKLNIIIVRPFNYTGIGQESHFLIPKILSHYKLGKEEIDLGNIDVFREFNDVNFVIRSYSELMLSNTNSEIINVCSGKALSVKNILDTMANIAGYKIKVNINPMFVRSNEIRTLKGSIKKMSHIIGDFTEEFKIENTLREMYYN
ncbi:GDP-mannose 4,6-dehydratase [Flavobacteriaceae bacterium LMO-SS05]